MKSSMQFSIKLLVRTIGSSNVFHILKVSRDCNLWKVSFSCFLESGALIGEPPCVHNSAISKFQSLFYLYRSNMVHFDVLYGPNQKATLIVNNRSYSTNLGFILSTILCLSRRSHVFHHLLAIVRSTKTETFSFSLWRAEIKGNNILISKSVLQWLQWYHNSYDELQMTQKRDPPCMHPKTAALRKYALTFASLSVTLEIEHYCSTLQKGTVLTYTR